MIEIAFDSNNNNLFKNQPYPLYKVSEFSGCGFTAYQQLARAIIAAYPDSHIIIIRNQAENCSINLLAVALFVEAYHLPNMLECAVFKVEDNAAAMEEYKPYIALTIGMRLALRLCHENTRAIYREIENMGYLGLNIKTDYIAQKIYVGLSGSGDTTTFTANTAQEAVAVAASLKALSLAQTGADIKAEIAINHHNTEINEQATVLQIVQNVNPWIETN